MRVLWSVSCFLAYVTSAWQPLPYSTHRPTAAFPQHDPTAIRTTVASTTSTTSLYNFFGDNNSKDGVKSQKSSKFGMAQRIDSLKSGIVGAIAGSFGSTVIFAVHDMSLAQWEFDTDAAAIAGGLFAIVYRYCIRMDDTNPQLAQGVIGSFCITRTLARITVSPSCAALPLQCGPPLSYINYDMIWQLVWNGLESVAIFGVAAWAIEAATDRGFISRFPG